MKHTKHILSIVSPETVIYIALFISTFSLLLTGIHSFCHSPQAAAENPVEIQGNIAKNIIRLHVIANSDTDDDQQLKLIVRDEIITSLQESLKNADSIDEAQKIIQEQQSQIEVTANKVLAEHGNTNTAQVSLRQRYFPVKQYGDLSFPAGTYQALCVEIGKAEGRNWWCVLFPSLCFVNETTATVPDTSKDKLKDCLSEEEYQYISEDEAAASPMPGESPSPDSSPDNETSSHATKPELRLGILDWLTGN